MLDEVVGAAVELDAVVDVPGQNTDSEVKCCGAVQAIQCACHDGIINGLGLSLRAAKALSVFCMHSLVL